jgi:SAM-dependent methyltransferase
VREATVAGGAATAGRDTTEGYDASNFRKHTSGNPVQRVLIDRFHRRILDRIAALEPGSFLDAGCGEGFVAKLLRERLPRTRLTGFDFNPDAVKLAARANPGMGLVTASIFALPYPDATFDVVGCFEVLEHQDDPTSALRELARVARRAVVVSVPHEPFFSLSNAARGKNWDVRPRGSDPDHRQLWSRAAFGAFVARDPDLEVEWLGGSFPWTICVARKR